ncbi:MAG: iron-sulfur cluster repair di-iron protein [Bacteroidetes bacterium]|nr:iron-sulfur cluster repair di-iron protein [Bacteroidota bacterium]
MQASETIGSVVANNIKTAHVFKKYKLDFCCGGGISIEKACQNRNIDVDSLLADLESANAIGIQKEHNYKEWSPTFLCDYIENQHHTYVRENLPILIQYANKVARVHGPNHEYLVSMQELVNELSNELLPHLEKEEKILFPFIRRMEANTNLNQQDFKIENPINVMLSEHDHAGAILKKLSKLTADFTAPEYACNTWRAYYDKLKEFEADLHLHIHLENNILFTKALAL